MKNTEGRKSRWTVPLKSQTLPPADHLVEKDEQLPVGWLPPADHLVEKDEQLSVGWMPPADHLIEQHEQADNCSYLWDSCFLQTIS